MNPPSRKFLPKHEQLGWFKGLERRKDFGLANTKIIFLDRDGVINEFPGNGNYVTRVKNFHFLPGALDAIRILTEEGHTVFVVSNQAGVGRGVYSQDKIEPYYQ